MYRCYFSVIDYRDHYSYDPDVCKSFETLEEARSWAESMTNEHVSYKFDTAILNGKRVDVNKYFLEIDYGVESIKDNMIRQLQEKIESLKSSSTIEEVLRFNNVWLYPVQGLDKVLN